VQPKSPRLKLNIDRLVVDAGGHVDQRALRAAVQQELARLMAEHGAPADPAAGGAWRADHRSVAKPGASASEIGAQVARAIYGGIGGQAQ
jgi:hypothetical protein